MRIQSFSFFGGNREAKKIVADFERKDLSQWSEFGGPVLEKRAEMFGFSDNLQYQLNSFAKEMIDVQILAELTLPTLHQQLYTEAWQWMKEKYIFSSKPVSLKQIHQTAVKLNQKHSKAQENLKGREGRQKMEAWGFGELKIFQTVCILYSLRFSIQLQEFAQPQYDYLRKIFLQKSENFLRYEVASLLRSRVKNTSEWKKAEIEILTKIVEEDDCFSTKDVHKIDKYQWRYYSFLMFTRSKGKYYRSLQQCREKWINHLNPDLNHAPWHIDEDIKLFEIIGVLGYKWAAISKAFDLQRTQHMVKNRFNSLTKTWRNKDIKNIPPHQVARKVLVFLREKAAKGTQIQKEQISKLFNQNTSTSASQEKDSTSQQPEDEQISFVQPNEVKPNQEKQCQKLPQLDNYIQQYATSYFSTEDNKHSINEWNDHFDQLDNRQYFCDKEQKNTWDDDEPLLSFKNERKEVNIDVIEIQGQNRFEFELGKSVNYMNSYGEFQNDGFANIRVFEQMRFEDDEWLGQFKGRQLLSWID